MKFLLTIASIGSWKLEVKTVDYKRQAFRGPVIALIYLHYHLSKCAYSSQTKMRHYSNRFSVYEEGKRKHLFIHLRNHFQGSFSVILPAVERQARILGRNIASLSTAPKSRFSLASHVRSRIKGYQYDNTRRKQWLEHFFCKSSLQRVVRFKTKLAAKAVVASRHLTILLQSKHNSSQ